MATHYVMKVSSNGQVSIPAEVRARWNAAQVVMVDLGDRVVVRPLPDEPVEVLKGKYRGRGANGERIRRQSRVEETASERRR